MLKIKGFPSGDCFKKGRQTFRFQERGIKDLCILSLWAAKGDCKKTEIDWLLIRGRVPEFTLFQTGYNVYVGKETLPIDSNAHLD